MRMRTQGRSFWWIVACGLAAVCVRVAAGEDETAVPAVKLKQGRNVRIDPAVREQAERSIALGLNWLAMQQRANGSWSSERAPSLTALPLWAFAKTEHPLKEKVVRRAVGFILPYVQENGGIYRPALLLKRMEFAMQNTAICLLALHAVDDPELAPSLLKARKFLADAQQTGDDMYRGGFGYGASQGPADLQNTTKVLEAMRVTADLEKRRGEGDAGADIDWDAARHFLERLQNPTNVASDDAGGFGYRPDSTQSGSGDEDPNKEGTLRTYGSLTYAGLLSLVYAQVARDDPRTRSAFDWAKNHWSLDENPGMGMDGLFFFFNVMSKALDAFGEDEFEARGGVSVKWREEFIKKIAALQKVEGNKGHWVNDKSGRFWESDPVLVTAYSILALEYAIGL